MKDNKNINKSRKSVGKPVGYVYVDSGCVMVGDPCYHIKDDNWREFLSKTYPTHESYSKKVTNALGEKGLGMIVSSGFGDGVYPVYVEEVDVPDWGRRVKSVTVVFIEDEDIEQEPVV